MSAVDVEFNGRALIQLRRTLIVTTAEISVLNIVLCENKIIHSLLIVALYYKSEIKDILRYVIPRKNIQLTENVGRKRIIFCLISRVLPTEFNLV